MIVEAIHRITMHRASLTREEARAVMQQVLSGGATDAQIGAFLVALLMRGETVDDEEIMATLSRDGSCMVPGFRDPEGIIVFHSASRQMYKRTFEQDGGKWRTLKVST